jgi:hypothetical protein
MDCTEDVTVELTNDGMIVHRPTSADVETECYVVRNAGLYSDRTDRVIDTQGKWWPYDAIKTLYDDLTRKELFSDPAKGQYVTFDVTSKGWLIKISWPLPGTGIGFLVWDRDGDGVIKDGTEVFGSHMAYSDGIWGDKLVGHPQPCRSPQAPTHDPPPNQDHILMPMPCNNNGFIALNYFDMRTDREVLRDEGEVAPQSFQRGGGFVDKNDPVWPHLFVWIDEHCYKAPDVPCRSEPSELHRPEEFNIDSIGYNSEHLYAHDSVGNRYRWYALLNPVTKPHEVNLYPSEDKRLAFDYYPTAVTNNDEGWPLEMLTRQRGR